MEKHIKRAACAALILSHLAACAQRPASIHPEYVSPGAYIQVPCDELSRLKFERVSELRSLEWAQDDAADADVAIFWVGLLLLWPVWFGFIATDDHAPRIAELKGQHAAMDTAYYTRPCP